MIEKDKTEVLQWWYDGKPVTEEDVPEGTIGMVYKIAMFPSADMCRWIRTGHLGMKEENATRKIYIGKKLLTSTQKKKIGVRAQAAEKLAKGDGRVKKVKKVVKNSGWMTYNSSNPELQTLLKEYPDLFTKTILKWCYSKKELSYEETAAQITHDVLRIDSFNGNVCGKWYRRDLIINNIKQ